jgi:hypothetical protein
MEFSEVRARWEQILIYSTHSGSRAPLVLDEQEQAVIPSEYDRKRGKPLGEVQKLMSKDLLAGTKAHLARFLREQVRPDGTSTWQKAADEKSVPEEVIKRRGLLMDINWPVAWFAHQVLAENTLRDAYVGPKDTRKEHYSEAERVEFLRSLSCLVAYALKAINENSPEPVTPPAPMSELEFGNALLYMVAEYGHVVLDLPRRLAIESRLQALLGSETGLYLTQDLYRDHTFHMVYVCLLGDFLLQCRLGTEELAVYLCGWCRADSPPLAPADIVRIMRRNWYLTALFHDLGYPLVLLRSVDRLTEFLDCEKIERLRKAIGEARSEAVGKFAKEAEECLRLGRRPAKDELDHGVVSAVVLRHLLAEAVEGDAALEEHWPAIRAIARHNLQDAKFSVGQAGPPPAWKPDNDSISLLLLLCDEAQEWGRVRVDPKRYRQEVAAKMQFGGENPLESQRILHRLAVNVRWEGDGFRFLGDEIILDLIYRPLRRSEESYLAIWLDRTRNFQRVSLADDPAKGKFVSIRVNSFWRHEARDGEELDDLQIVANYVRNHHRWELDRWLDEAWDSGTQRVEYQAPKAKEFGWFKIHLNELAGTTLLPQAPDIGKLFHWLRTYPARLSFRTSSPGLP